MPNEEWGTKRLCPTTGKRFYDLNKNPIVSPYTGEVLEVDASKSRMIAADAEDAVTAKAKAAEVDDEAEILDDDDVDAMAREAAQFLGLDYQRILTGDQYLESALKVSVNFTESV